MLDVISDTLPTIKMLPLTVAVAKEKTYPISELFGGTIQGEGPLAGVKTYFLRFAGCDWLCSWCDTKYAVRPVLPDGTKTGWKRIMMTGDEIKADLDSRGIQVGEWLTLSGGNPALFFDEALAIKLGYYRLAMETQGSVVMPVGVNDRIDSLIVSPKPPSSGMVAENDRNKVFELVNDRRNATATALKYVIFDEEDLEWVVEFDKWLLDNPQLYYVKHYLSAGTPLPEGQQVYLSDNPGEEDLALSRKLVCDRLKWLFEKVASDPRLREYVVFPQLHTLAWGQKKGV